METITAKKLDTKTIVSDFKTMIDSMAHGEVVELYSIVGQSNEISTGNSQHGLWIAFKGEFMAQVVDKETGEITKRVMAPKAHLPAPMDDILFSGMMKAYKKVHGKDCEGIKDGSTQTPTTDYKNLPETDFALTISAKRNVELAVGYTYIVNSLQEIKPSDKLSHLAGLIPTGEAAKKIAAPVEEKPSEEKAKGAKSAKGKKEEAPA